MILGIGKSGRLGRRATVLALFGALVALCARPSLGDDSSWIYRRSYFSHNLPPSVQAQYPVPESRSAYRIPMVYESPGAGIQGVYRYNPIIMYDGRSSDVTVYRQNWFQLQP